MTTLLEEFNRDNKKHKWIKKGVERHLSNQELIQMYETIEFFLYWVAQERGRCKELFDVIINERENIRELEVTEE